MSGNAPLDITNVEHDFAPTSTTKDLPNPEQLLDFHQQEYLAPLSHVISAEPTCCVIVIPTHGRGFQSIKDTANGKPHGGHGTAAAPIAGGEATARKFKVVALELLSVGVYTTLSGGTTDGEPYIVRLESPEDAKAYMDALPFCYVASAFAKEDSAKIVAANWHSFIVDPATASHANANYGLGGKGQSGRMGPDSAVSDRRPGSKVTGNIRFTAEPRLGAKIYSRPSTSAARFNPDKAWVARPSTTETWLSHNGED